LKEVGGVSKALEDYVNEYLTASSSRSSLSSSRSTGDGVSSGDGDEGGENSVTIDSGEEAAAAAVPDMNYPGARNGME